MRPVPAHQPEEPPERRAHRWFVVRRVVGTAVPVPPGAGERQLHRRPPPGQGLPERLGEVDAAVHLDRDAGQLQALAELGGDPLPQAAR
jgi:hypothetical protein